MATETWRKTTDQHGGHGFKASPVADAVLYTCISSILIATASILINNLQTCLWRHVESQIPPLRQGHGSENGT